MLKLYWFTLHRSQVPNLLKTSLWQKLKNTATQELLCCLHSVNGHTFSSTDNKILSHLVQQNKQYHMKVLLSSFHLNGHTLGFHPQTQKKRTTLQA